MRHFDPITITMAELAAVVSGDLDDAVAPLTEVALGPRGVAIHSALIDPGALFFALAGRRDGHDWVLEALANKAACAVVTRSWAAPADAQEPAAMPLLRVDDPLRALQALAAWYRRQLRCHVVTVAGSLGKTTTKDAVVAFLNESVFCYGSPGSFNSQLGVPLSVLWCPPNAEYAVFEVAATEPGEIERLAKILRPDTILITTIGERFRRSFGSAADFAAELCGLAAHARTDGAARVEVICGDTSTDVAPYVPVGVTVLATTDPAWPVLAVVRSSTAEMSISLRVGDVRGADAATRSIDVVTSSSWVAGNVALAAATCVALGRTPQARSYSPTSVDLQTWRSPNGVHLIRSAAVDEPMAWRTAIADAVQAASGTGRVFVVLSEAANAVSDETLTALGDVGLDRPLSVLATPGRAATFLARVDGLALRIFETPPALSIELAAEVGAGDVVSVITGRGELIEGISKDLLEAMAPTKLRIDVSAIEINLSTLRRQCPDAQIMAVVKAGAYGADAPELARHLVALGVDQFAVSQADEGVRLRRSGVATPILVLLATPDELEKAQRAHLTICVHSPELLQAVLADHARVLDVHVEVDTGMRRTGLAADETVPALLALRDAGVPVSGLLTHLAAADDPAHDDLTRAQLRVFDEVVEAVGDSGLEIPMRHVLASAGVIRFPEHAMEMVRVGLALHGIPPSPHCQALSLVPSLTLTSRLIDRRELDVGDRVGYGGTFQADRPLVAGVVQLGYHDGVFRSFQRGGAVVVNGRRCPVIGRVSMDSMVVDLSACPEAEVGSDVLIFGTQGESSQAIDDVAEAMGTIAYEVISRLGPRVQRVFVRH
ncbi:MAG: alanine racemase [Ilumatobacteraceae bacterium]